MIGGKPGAARLGFAALLKFFEIDGRFPEYAAEVPERVVRYLAEQLKVDPALFGEYQWSGRTSERHRAQVRKALGFRECGEADQEGLVEWLSREVCPMELRREALRDAVLARCRSEKAQFSCSCGEPQSVVFVLVAAFLPGTGETHSHSREPRTASL